VALLFVAPILGAVAGGIGRGSRDSAESWPAAAANGMIAGVAAVLLYLVPQLIANPRLFDDSVPASLFAVVIVVGLTSGLTTDRIFAKIQKTDVLATAAIDARLSPRSRAKEAADGG
jgi:hypothetical protein